MSPPLAFANSGVPTFLDNAYVEAGYSHGEQTRTYTDPNVPKHTVKTNYDAYSLTLGKEFGDYDASLAYSKPESGKGSYTLSGSKKFNQLEVGLSYTLPNKSEQTDVVANNRWQFEAKTDAISVFTSYDFKTANPALTPYVGADITRYSTESTSSNLSTGYVNRESINYFTYGVNTGVKYDINKNVRVSGGVSYSIENSHDVGTTKNEGDGYGVGLKARYTFK